ncbi:hypothetical protein QBC40DRAFT_313343 [Triangularia verruculosa]|uniref:Uncharacterized protein n=1 Tax=Triangularia verruculosa TaxID=2587418 RepID=A0AAN6X9J1_9PEZI|nr:hypothetical protein QBC40DRAFT_313343 [Triangularia verruculosa]
MAAVAQPPPDSPLPRLPAKSPGLPPPMSVPRRRPVAATVTSPTAPAPTSLSSPTIPERVPSPAGSYSSILSAYSNHTSDSTPRTSTNSANEVVPIVPSKDSYSVSSPTLGNGSHIQSPTLPPLPSDQHAQTQKTNTATPQVFKEDLEELPPPPPLKDAQRLARPQTPTSLQTSSSVQPPASTHTAASPLVDNSSPQDQLWRRRSLKAEKKVDVPELKLISSHGSTAASNGTSQPTSQPQLSQQQDQPPTTTTQRAPPAPNFAGGLPGRNIRPVNSVPQIEVNMGQEVSHVKDKLRRKASESPPSPGAKASSPASSLPVVSPLSAQRLPTPEYGANDIKSPVLEMAVSPISPAITPELPNEQRPPPPPIPRSLGPSEHILRQARSSPNLAPKASNGALNSRSPIGLPSTPVPNRDRFANPPLSARFRSEESGLGFGGPNRRDPAGGPILESQAPFQRQTQSRPQSPSAWGNKPISENGSEITLRAPPIRPEFLDFPLREPDPNAPDETDNPGAGRFPRNWYTPLPADEILDARPLENKHFRCITSHKIMTAGKQRNNPIGCRTCGHKDRNAECYICSACHLNVCSGCAGLLKRNRGDLGTVLKAVEQALERAMPEVGVGEEADWVDVKSDGGHAGEI